MKHWNRWQIGLCLAGIFAAGAVTGAALTVAVTKRVVQKRVAQAEAGDVSWIVDRIAGRLKLDRERRARVEEIVRRHAAELREARQSAQGEAFGVMRRAEAEIAAELTPEQAEEMRKMGEERRARLRRFLGRDP